MDDPELPIMDSLKLELYGNVPEPQHQPDPKNLGSQARALEREIGDLFEKLACQ